MIPLRDELGALSSASMPRRPTLYKIADGLELSEVDIATEWTR
jgi:hypothetical protein